MNVLIDNEPFASDAETLGEAIDAARQPVLEAGRLIVEVRLDGRTLDDSDMEELAERNQPGAEVQLITADPVDLCLQALEDVREGLGVGRQAQQEAAAKLQGDEPDAAMETIAMALVAWQQCQQAVGQTAKLLDMPLDELTVNDRPATQMIEDLAERLVATREQLNSSDWLGLADSLAYDLDEAANEWVQLLDVMIERVRQKQAGDG